MITHSLWGCKRLNKSEKYGNVTECVKKLLADFGRRKALPVKVEETVILIDNPMRTHENIAAVSESVR